MKAGSVSLVILRVTVGAASGDVCEVQKHKPETGVGTFQNWNGGFGQSDVCSTTQQKHLVNIYICIAQYLPKYFHSSSSVF